jgi:hypothetical protein
VLERPASGNYDMLVFGTADDVAALFPDLGDCSVSLGLADCSDLSLENISFLNYGCLPEADQSDLSRLAFYGLTSQGFGWGLENLEGTGQIMASYSATGVKFGEVCTTISGTSNCSHEGGCADGEQNSTEDLMARFGARVDDGPPTVAITAPADGEIVDPDFEVTADVHDEFGGVLVELEIVEATQTLEDSVPPHSWGLSGVTTGTWTLQVTATDADGGVASDEIVVCVGLDECDPGDGGTGTGDGGDGGDDGGTGDDGSGDGGTGDGGTDDGGTGDGGTGTGGDGGGGGFEDPKEDSCECRTHARGSLASGLAMLVLLCLRRRRR